MKAPIVTSENQKFIAFRDVLKPLPVHPPPARSKTTGAQHWLQGPLTALLWAIRWSCKSESHTDPRGSQSPGMAWWDLEMWLVQKPWTSSKTFILIKINFTYFFIFFMWFLEYIKLYMWLTLCIFLDTSELERQILRTKWAGTKL